MHEQDRGITAEMIVKFIICIIMGAMFFLPWIRILFIPVSGAKAFPALLDVLNYSDYKWVAYLFILLYLIPLLCIICIINFLAQNRLKMHKNFISLCTVSIFELAILILLGAYINQSMGDFGKAVVSLLANVETAFWILLGMAVFGLIFSGVAGPKRQVYPYEDSYYQEYPQHPEEDNPDNIVLFVTEGRYKGVTFQIPETGLVIGSNPNMVGLVIPDLSEKHCIITYNSNKTGLSVKSFSPQGIYIDKTNKLIPGLVYYVFPGQMIHIGNSEIFEVR